MTLQPAHWGDIRSSWKKSEGIWSSETLKPTFLKDQLTYPENDCNIDHELSKQTTEIPSYNLRRVPAQLITKVTCVSKRRNTIQRSIEPNKLHKILQVTSNIISNHRSGSIISNVSLHFLGGSKDLATLPLHRLSRSFVSVLCARSCSSRSRTPSDLVDSLAKKTRGNNNKTPCHVVVYLGIPTKVICFFENFLKSHETL